MSRNGAGTYTLVAGNPVVTGTTISSAWANNTLSDIATALTNSIAVDGQSPITANIPMSSHKLTGLAAATTSGDAISYAQASWSLAAGTLTGALAMSGAAINTAQGTDVASAGTIDLDAATGNVVDITGTTAITAVTLSQGRTRIARFTGILTLTNGASLVVQGGANITTAAGDYAIFIGYASSVVRVLYFRASGLPVVNPTVTIPRSYLAGCTISNGTDTVNDINIAAGQCTDSTNAVTITVAAMAGKQLDAGWAPGANAGMRNSAIAIANTTYHIYAVAKADGTQDIYAHTSTVVATVITALQAEAGGASYLYARRIASIVRAGGTILQFVQDGDLFQLVTPVADVSSGAAPGTAAITRTLASIPTGLNLLADLSMIYSVADNVTGGYMLVTDLATTDTTPSASISDTPITISSAAAVTIAGFNKRVRTNTSAQVRARVSYSSASVTYIINTLGYTDSRGKNL